MRCKHLVLTAAAVLGQTGIPRSQIGVDPQAELRRIAEKVAEDMQELDRLLSRSAPTSEAREALDRVREGLQKMLDDAQGTSQRVQKGLDELLQALEQQGGQQGQQDQQPPEQQQGGQERQPGTRQQTQTPDMVEQPQGQHQQGQQPRASRNPEQGTNRPATQAPPDDGTERAQHGTDAATWGSLPDYFGSARQRGSLPEVSEKYRKLYDAYLKAQAKASPAGSDKR